MAKNKSNMQDRDWNDNQGFLERLDTRFSEANIAANDGLLVTWYRNLRTIYRIMHCKIEEDTTKIKIKDEEVSLEEFFIASFQKTKEKITALNRSYGSKMLSNQMQSFSIEDSEGLLDQVDEKLCDLYVKYFIRLETKSRDPNTAIKEVFDR